MQLRIVLTFLTGCLVLAAPAFGQPTQTYQEWLEHYGAWDRLEQQIATETAAETPAVILKRAQVYLNLNSPAKALEIIEMTPAFEDSYEAERLWMGGRAHRGLGDLTKAVLWFSQAGKHMSDAELQARFRSETGLETVWQDVWLKMFWSYSANHTLSRDSQREALSTILTAGRKVWDSAFWQSANNLFGGGALETQTATSSSSMVSQADTRLIAQAMAAVSLEKFEEASGFVNGLTQPAVRTFWMAVVDFLKDGNPPDQLNVFKEANLLKANAFWAGNVLAPYSTSREQWFLGNPDSGPWTQFRNNILEMSQSEAERAIDNELGSMLISEQTTNLLNNFKLALALSNGDFTSSTTTWNNLNKQSLPISLRLAGILAFKESFNKVLPEKPAEAYALYPVLASLAAAAGQESQARTEAPFWTAAPADQLQSLAKVQYPLDRLLLLAYWQQFFAATPTVELAKRAAYLYDDSSFGIQSLIYLADDAVKTKRLQLGAYYLNQIDDTTLPANLKMAWLDIKTRLELESGRQATALDTYKLMTDSGEPIPVMTRLRMALLYQQRNQYEDAQKELLTMWDARASLTSALQAETLFWLGEGEYAMHNPDKALDYYLRLAWQYPGENIWALTAMYRASLIYEKRGKYETAKKLLGTVVRNAARPEQRGAAKARIDAIDKKMGEENLDPADSTLVYPF